MRFPAHGFRPTAHGARRHTGMTLIELIVVITISGIISSMLVYFIVGSMQSYEAQVRRAELVDAAEMALRRMARDIRQALPNSVRVDATGRVIEMLNTVDGARYRDGPGNIGHNHGPTAFRLRIPGTDGDGFNIVGFFPNITVPCAAACAQYRLSIYNQGVTGADAYADASLLAGRYVITNPLMTAFTIAKDGGGFNDEDQVLPAGASSFNFRYASPNQRVFIVDTPVTYACDTANKTITRYSSYAIAAAQPTNPAAAPLSAATNIALLSTPVTACTFTYSPGTNQRAGLVTLDITVSDTTSGDVVRLLYQAHVDNSP
jgi:MSHA biogenesis protein MshO